MATWTAPTTRSTGDLISASIWNTDLTENLKFLKDAPVIDTAVIIGAATTSGIRLDLESGTLAVREGDDSAYGPIKTGALTTSGAAILQETTGTGQISLRTNSTTSQEIHIRPSSGKSGYLSFTEDSVADRWVVHSKTGSAVLGFASGSYSSHTDRLLLSTTTLTPGSNDGLALGSGSVSWSDLFLASGGVVDWANGNVKLTHATGNLQLTANNLFLNGTSSINSTTNTIEVTGSSSAGTAQPSFQVIANTGTSAGQCGYVVLYRSRGTTNGSVTAVTDGDRLGMLRFAGADGTSATVRAAEIYAEVDTTPGTNDMPGRLVFATTPDGSATPSERARITSGGYFKASNDGTYYGSTSSYHELRTTNNTNIAKCVNTNASPQGINIHYTGATPNSTGSDFVYCEDSTGPRATFRSNGGLVNYQANDANLSDARTKRDVKPLGSMWDKFKALEIVTFKYNDQTHDDDNIGVIAQQVEAVAPEFVDVDGFGETPADGVPLKTIYTTDLYHAAIKALQEAMARIEALEARLN